MRFVVAAVAATPKIMREFYFLTKYNTQICSCALEGEKKIVDFEGVVNLQRTNKVCAYCSCCLCARC